MWEDTGSMHYWRLEAPAIAFPDPNNSENDLVLFVGGDCENDYTTCEIYNPATGSFALTGSLLEGKCGSKLVYNSELDVIMTIGGWGSNGMAPYHDCEIYDIATGVWTQTEPTDNPRDRHTTIYNEKNATVLVIGSSYSPHNSCEIYDFATGQWSITDSLETDRWNHCSEILLNGKTLAIAGLSNEIGTDMTSEIYDEINGWQITTPLNAAYQNFSSEILNNESVLIMKYCSEIYTWNYMPIVSQPQGPAQGTIGETLTFSITASDPDNDSVSVHIVWGNNQITDWTECQPSGSTFELSHSWTEPGVYQVRAQTADQWYFENPLTHNSISEWSEPFVLTVIGIPEIEVSVDSLNFGSVYIGEDSLLTLSVSNLGNGTLTANAYTNTEEFSAYPSSFNLEPGENLNIEITFIPIYEGVITDTLTISSNDPENPEMKVSLTGEGQIGIPQIFVSTDSLNFGSVFIGSDSLLTLSVSNLGYGLLTANAHTNTDEYSVDPSHFNIEPNQNLNIEITFAPTYEGIITDTLIILSNDPENPEVEVSLTGEGQILVSADNNQLTITNFELRNHPNPFNPSTTISFSLNTKNTSHHNATAWQAEDTEIIIYNLKGQKVRVLELASPSPFFADGVGYSKNGYSKMKKNYLLFSTLYFNQLRT